MPATSSGLLRPRAALRPHVGLRQRDAALARLARPQVAMITTVAPAHMEAFGSLDGIAVEKASIFEGLEPAGHAILPEDLGVTPILRDAADRAGAIVVGFGRDGVAKPVKTEVAEGETRVRARVLGEVGDPV